MSRLEKARLSKNSDLAEFDETLVVDEVSENLFPKNTNLNDHFKAQ